MLANMDTAGSIWDAVGTFLGKIDWRHPLTYLVILGAIGAPEVFVRACRSLKVFWNTTLLQIRHPSVFKDFYFITRDFGYRIMEDGNTYLNVRRETVVSKVKRLESIPFRYMWSGQGKIEEAIQPKTMTIRDRPKLAGKVDTRRSIFFERPLRKREKCSLVLHIKCVASEKHPEPFISSTSTRRVDKLILRVAFPLGRHPTHVAYRLLDDDGNEKSRRMLECSDYLTGEYRVEIKYPKPFYEHRIEWE